MKAELERERKGKEGKKKNNMTKMTRLIEEGARFGASEEALAAYANAVHIDDGIDLSQHPEMVVGKSKVHTQKVKRYTELAEQAVESTAALYIDGKKFETLSQEKLEDGEFHQKIEKEEHYVITDATRQKFIS